MASLPPEFWWRAAAMAAPQVGLPSLSVPFELAGGVSEYRAADPRLQAYRGAKQAEAARTILTAEQERALREGPPRTGGQIAGSTLSAVEARAAQAGQIREKQQQAEQIRPVKFEPPRSLVAPGGFRPFPPIGQVGQAPKTLSEPSAEHLSASQLAQLARLLASLERRG